MASPQRENGHIDIANDIVDQLAKINLSSYEWRILWAILRKTWGYVVKDQKGRWIYDKYGQPIKKKMDWVSVSQLEDLTGLDRRNVSRTKLRLLERKIILKSGNRLGFNKDYEQWVSSKSTIGKPEVSSKSTIDKPLSQAPTQKQGVVDLDDSKNQVSSKSTIEVSSKSTTTKDIRKNKESIYRDTQSQLSAEDELTPEQIREGDRLMGIYCRAHRGYLARLTKEFQIRRKIRMRQLIDGTMLEGISSKLIEATIKESSSGVPWDILTESWIIKQINRKKLKEGTKGTWY